MTDRRGFVRLCIVVLCVAGVHARGVEANSGSVRLGSGGIVFLKNNDIRLVSEVLEIALDKIRVTYRFRNEADKPVRITMGFPMPSRSDLSSKPAGWIIGPSYFASVKIPPIVSFVTRVNGQPVMTTRTWHILANGKDISMQLRGLGYSDADILKMFESCFEADGTPCPDAEKGYVVAERLTGKLDFSKPWGIFDTAVWEQEFPSRREVVITHEYAPATGMAWGVSVDADMLAKIRSGWNPPVYLARSYDDRSCVRDGTGSAINKQIKLLALDPRVTTVNVHIESVEYLLANGANWKGPIGDFRLFVRLADPKDFVSLCFPGKPRRLDAATFEFTQKNFIPPKRLIVDFYRVTSNLDNR